jgi:hypothetical protein
MPLPEEFYLTSGYLAITRLGVVGTARGKCNGGHDMLQAHGMVPALLCEVGHVAGGVLAALRSLYSRCKLTGYKLFC